MSRCDYSMANDNQYHLPQNCVDRIRYMYQFWYFCLVLCLLFNLKYNFILWFRFFYKSSVLDCQVTKYNLLWKAALFVRFKAISVLKMHFICVFRQITLLQKTLINSSKIFWIPAHKGYSANEYVDRFTRKAAGTPFLGTKPSIPISTEAVNFALDGSITKR